jgi:glucose/arabinose dehydrogenase
LCLWFIWLYILPHNFGNGKHHMTTTSLYSRFGKTIVALSLASTLALLGACGASEDAVEPQAALEVDLEGDFATDDPSIPPAAFTEGLIKPSGDVSLADINLPDGFKITEWAQVEGARSMVVGDGYVIVGTQGDAVHALPFDKTTMQAGAVVTLGTGMKMPNGIALVNGVLYIAEQHRVVRWGDAAFDVANPVQTATQIGPDLPDLWHHGWRYMATTPDNQLLVATGSPCNVCTPKELEGSIIRLDPATGAFETIATGIRNSVGVTIQPSTGVAFFTDNGADMMGDDTPPGELNRLSEDGKDYGFPWYGGGHDRTPDFKDATPPEGLVFPAMDMQPHAASLGFVFYQGDMFPASYKGSIILAQHGSWNRTFPVGYRLMHLPVGADGNPTSKAVFADGWLVKGDATGRPVDVKELPDGSLLVSDDMGSVIYRITYSAE